MGTVSFVATGNLVAGAGNNVSPVFPSGVLAGHIAVLVVANKLDTEAPNTPAGWTAPPNNACTGGTGAAGVDSGPLRITVFTKECDGTESLTTVTVSFTTHTGAQAVIHVYSKDTGTWNTAGSGDNTGDTTSGTDFSVTMGLDPGVATGDMVGGVYAYTSDTPTAATNVVSVPGCTLGAVTQMASTGTTNGNDLRTTSVRAPVTAGTSTGVATISNTASVATTGAGFLYRVRAGGGGPVALDAKGSAAAQGASLLAATRPLTAKGSAAANAPASLGALRPLGGKGSAGASAGAGLGTSRPSSATGSSAASASGALTVTLPGGGPKALDGAGKAAASGQGILALGRPLAGSGAASGVGKGTSGVLRSLGGTSSGASSARGGLSGARSEIGKASAAADARGVLGKTLPTAGVTSAAANASASLTVTPAATLIVRRVETQRSNERWYWRKIPWDAR